MTVKGKRVLILGGTSGIGLAVAKAQRLKVQMS
jgi:short-subunit dehydrogenase involved in D-alanine esterification of teichoic acids